MLNKISRNGTLAVQRNKVFDLVRNITKSKNSYGTLTPSVVKMNVCRGRNDWLVVISSEERKDL